MKTTVLLPAISLLLLASVVRAQQPELSVEELAANLGSEEVSVRRDAAYALNALGAAAYPAVAALTAALSDEDRQVSSEAVSALARIGPRAAAAIDELIEKLDSDPQRSYRSAYTLGKIGGAALPALRTAVRSREVQVRSSAIKAIGWMGEAGLSEIGLLLNCLDDESARVRDSSVLTLAKLGKPTIVPLTELLKDGSDRQRETALRALAAHGTAASSAETTVSGLTSHPEPAIRSEALTAFALIGSSETEILSVLMTGLKDSDLTVQAAAADGVIRLGPRARAAIPEIRELLNSDQAVSVRNAATILGRLSHNDESTATALVQTLNRNQEPTAREAVLGALGKAGSVAVTALLEHLEDEKLVEPASDIIARQGDDTRERLVQASAGDKALSRSLALLSLGKFPANDASRKAVVSALDDPNDLVRSSAIRSLASVHDHDEVLARLVGVSADSSALVRASAIESAAGLETDDPRRSQTILAGLQDKDKQVRAIAANSLLQLDSLPVESAVTLSALLNSDSKPIQLGAVQSLAKIGEPASAAVPAIVQLSRSEDPELRAASLKALGSFGEHARIALARLAEALDDPEAEIRIQSLQTLAKLDEAAREVYVAIEQKLQDAESDVRAQAVITVSQISSEESDLIDLLIRTLTDDHWLVRKRVAESLQRRGEKAQDAVIPLMDLLDNFLDRRAASNALRQIGKAKPEAMAALIERLNHSNGYVKYFACRFLGDLGAKAHEALPRIKEIAANKDNHERLREAARSAIKRIEQE